MSVSGSSKFGCSVLMFYVADGRVYFTVPNRFAASFTVLGGTIDDPWWCSDIEFLFETKGERSTAVRKYPTSFFDRGC